VVFGDGAPFSAQLHGIKSEKEEWTIRRNTTCAIFAQYSSLAWPMNLFD
jgi:hypothetical protein